MNNGVQRCPYCNAVMVKGEDADDVVKCFLCGDVFCELCVARHFHEKHKGMIRVGFLDPQAIFVTNENYSWED